MPKSPNGQRNTKRVQAFKKFSGAINLIQFYAFGDLKFEQVPRKDTLTGFNQQLTQFGRRDKAAQR